MNFESGRAVVPLSVVGAGSPSTTVWPGPRPTSTPSFILIRPNIWPQYTNVTDRQQRQWFDSTARTVFGRPFANRFALCYQTVVLSVLSVCLSVLYVTLVCSGQTVGWIKMKLDMQVGLGPGHIVLDGVPPPPQRGTAKWLDGLRCHLYGGRPRPRRLCVRRGTSRSQLPLPKKGAEPFPNFRPISIVVKQLDGSRWHLARR